MSKSPLPSEPALVPGAHVELIQFVLDRAQAEPPAKRARLYRAQDYP